MKAPIALALGIAALLAVAGAAGYVAFVNHGQLFPWISAGNVAGEGTVNVYVKDAPANWTHVYVTFSEVQVHAADQGNASGWYNLTTGPKTVDLASLVTVSELLGSAKVPAGMYTQLRIVVMAAQGVLQNGTTENFTVPSGELKTDDPFNVTTGQAVSLTVDIDLSRSIVWTAEGYLFLPVIGSVQSS